MPCDETMENSSPFEECIGAARFAVDSERYTTMGLLGQGAFGVVIAGSEKKTGKKVAIKRICPIADTVASARHILREVAVMRLLRLHPNIISLKEVRIDMGAQALYIVMELMECDLQKILTSGQVLTASHVKVLLKQLLLGVQAMHDQGIIHRDLKPANILVLSDCQLRITDFGLARRLKRSAADEKENDGTGGMHLTEYVVTRWYRAPEVMLGPEGNYAEPVDMWSVGCILGEMLGSRGPLFRGRSYIDQVHLVLASMGVPDTSSNDALGYPVCDDALRFLRTVEITGGMPLEYKVPSEAGDTAFDLLRGLLDMNVKIRLTAQRALRHQYLSDCPELPTDSVETERVSSEEDVDFSFDDTPLTLDELRQRIIAEAAHYKDESRSTTAIRDLEHTQIRHGESGPHGIDSDSRFAARPLRPSISLQDVLGAVRTQSRRDQYPNLDKTDALRSMTAEDTNNEGWLNEQHKSRKEDCEPSPPERPPALSSSFSSMASMAEAQDWHIGALGNLGEQRGDLHARAEVIVPSTGGTSAVAPDRGKDGLRGEDGHVLKRDAGHEAPSTSGPHRVVCCPGEIDVGQNMTEISSEIGDNKSAVTPSGSDGSASTDVWVHGVLDDRNTIKTSTAMANDAGKAGAEIEDAHERAEAMEAHAAASAESDETNTSHAGRPENVDAEDSTHPNPRPARRGESQGQTSRGDDMEEETTAQSDGYVGRCVSGTAEACRVPNNVARSSHDDASLIMADGRTTRLPTGSENVKKLNLQVTCATQTISLPVMVLDGQRGDDDTSLDEAAPEGSYGKSTKDQLKGPDLAMAEDDTSKLDGRRDSIDRILKRDRVGSSCGSQTQDDSNEAMDDDSNKMPIAVSDTWASCTRKTFSPGNASETLSVEKRSLQTFKNDYHASLTKQNGPALGHTARTTSDQLWEDTDDNGICQTRGHANPSVEVKGVQDMEHKRPNANLKDENCTIVGASTDSPASISRKKGKIPEAGGSKLESEIQASSETDYKGYVVASDEGSPTVDCALGGDGFNVTEDEDGYSSTATGDTRILHEDESRVSTAAGEGKCSDEDKRTSPDSVDETEVSLEDERLNSELPGPTDSLRHDVEGTLTTVASGGEEGRDDVGTTWTAVDKSRASSNNEENDQEESALETQNDIGLSEETGGPDLASEVGGDTGRWRPAHTTECHVVARPEGAATTSPPLDDVGVGGHFQNDSQELESPPTLTTEATLNGKAAHGMDATYGSTTAVDNNSQWNDISRSQPSKEKGNIDNDTLKESTSRDMDGISAASIIPKSLPEDSHHFGAINSGTPSAGDAEEQEHQHSSVRPGITSEQMLSGTSSHTGSPSPPNFPTLALDANQLVTAPLRHDCEIANDASVMGMTNTPAAAAEPFYVEHEKASLGRDGSVRCVENGTANDGVRSTSTSVCNYNDGKRVGEQSQSRSDFVPSEEAIGSKGPATNESVGVNPSVHTQTPDTESETGTVHRKHGDEGTVATAMEAKASIRDVEDCLRKADSHTRLVPCSDDEEPESQTSAPVGNSILDRRQFGGENQCVFDAASGECNDATFIGSQGSGDVSSENGDVGPLPSGQPISDVHDRRHNATEGALVQGITEKAYCGTNLPETAFVFSSTNERIAGQRQIGSIEPVTSDTSTDASKYQLMSKCGRNDSFNHEKVRSKPPTSDQSNVDLPQNHRETNLAGHERTEKTDDVSRAAERAEERMANGLLAETHAPLAMAAKLEGEAVGNDQRQEGGRGATDHRETCEGYFTASVVEECFESFRADIEANSEKPTEDLETKSFPKTVEEAIMRKPAVGTTGPPVASITVTTEDEARAIRIEGEQQQITREDLQVPEEVQTHKVDEDVAATRIQVTCRRRAARRAVQQRKIARWERDHGANTAASEREKYEHKQLDACAWREKEEHAAVVIQTRHHARAIQHARVAETRAYQDEQYQFGPGFCPHASGRTHRASRACDSVESDRDIVAPTSRASRSQSLEVEVGRVYDEEYEMQGRAAVKIQSHARRRATSRRTADARREDKQQRSREQSLESGDEFVVAMNMEATSTEPRPSGQQQVPELPIASASPTVASSSTGANATRRAAREPLAILRRLRDSPKQNSKSTADQFRLRVTTCSAIENHKMKTGALRRKPHPLPTLPRWRPNLSTGLKPAIQKSRILRAPLAKSRPVSPLHKCVKYVNASMATISKQRAQSAGPSRVHDRLYSALYAAESSVAREYARTDRQQERQEGAHHDDGVLEIRSLNKSVDDISVGALAPQLSVQCGPPA